jgi:hypothetical protein
MTDAADTIDVDAEFNAVLGHLINERTPVHGKLDVAAIALLRQVARLLLSDSPRDAKDVAELLRLAPPVARRITVEPTVEELESRRPDLSVLSDVDLDELFRLMALARGLAQDVPRLCARRNAGLALARRLNAVDFEELDVLARNVLIQDVRGAVELLIAPLRVTEVFAIADRAAEVRVLEDTIRRLERDLHQAKMQADGKLVSLAGRRDASAASPAAAVAAPAGRVGFTGDHPGFAS